VKMEAERELPLEIVFHQRVGATGVGGRDFHERMVFRPVIVGPAAGRDKTVSLRWRTP
jgi:hypothetical protein